jgi:hypothetical protein
MTPPMRKMRQTPPRDPEKEAHHPSLCRSRRPRPHTHSRPPETSQNLPSRSPHPQNPLHPYHRQVSPSPSTKKNAFRSALHLSRAGPEETRALKAAYHQRIHRDQSNLTPLDSETFIQTALELLASDRCLQKAWASWPWPGAGPPRSSLALPSATLRYPALIFDGQLENPASSRYKFRALPHPVLGGGRNKTNTAGGRPQEMYGLKT